MICIIQIKRHRA